MSDRSEIGEVVAGHYRCHHPRLAAGWVIYFGCRTIVLLVWRLLAIAGGCGRRLPVLSFFVVLC